MHGILCTKYANALLLGVSLCPHQLLSSEPLLVI